MNVDDLHDAINSLLEFNDDVENNILLSLDQTKSIYKAIDTNNYWQTIIDELKSYEIQASIQSVKSLLKRNDKEFSEEFLETFKYGIEDLKNK